MHRFDLQDWQWKLIADLFPARRTAGGWWREHRVVMNGMFHVLHTGCPWRDLPERYGPWQTVYHRFNLYRRNGTFELMLKRLQARLDKLGRIDWTFWCFDGTSVRATRCAAGAKKPPAGRRWAAAGAGLAASCT